MPTTINRRDFILTSGYLSIGFCLLGCAPDQKTTAQQNTEFQPDVKGENLPPETQIDAWLQILEDGNIRILTGKMELGQGLIPVMQQVAGEELNFAPSDIEVIISDTGRTPNEGYTAGSRSVSSGAMNVRRAAAAARQRLLELAADKWNTDSDQLTYHPGYILHTDNNQQLTFQELLSGEQLSTTIPDQVPLKPKSQYQWVGQPIPHPEMEKIVRGQALYVQDMELPGMVHARVVRPPVYNAKLVSWDKALKETPGVLKIVSDGSFLGIIADDEYIALKTSETLRETTKWEGGDTLPEVASWADYMAAQSGIMPYDPQSSGITHHAIYSKPYIMHAAIGPSCAIAIYKKGQLQIWSHTQGVYPLRSTISDMTGLDENNIRIIGVRGSGCYGHNGADDVAADAAVLAMAYPGYPVRLQWEREDEHLWEPYGSAMRMELSARLDKTGKIEEWSYHVWSDAHNTRPRGDAQNLIAARYLSDSHNFEQPNRVGGGARNAPPYYTIPQAEVEEHYVRGPLRTSALRSLGAYANIYAIESFMEELSEKAGQSPLDFRIRHLEDERAIEVIRQLRTMLADEKVNKNEGIGYGFARYKNSAAYCAVAAKVQVQAEQKAVRPIKMWAVIEAGETINPDGLKNQTEGGMIQAASWTLLEEVTFNNKAIQSRDWTSYDIIRFDHIPETVVKVIDRPDQPAMGAGEAAQGPAGAAIANAIYTASGKRVRHLPAVKTLFR